MAHGHEHPAALVASSSLAPPDPLTEQDQFKLQQYEKIVQLGDLILSGNHPTIRPSGPPAVGGKAEVTRTGAPNGIQIRSVATNPGARAGDVARGLGQDVSISNSSARTNLNSTLLEKSEDPQSLEFRVKRQKLEQDIRDEWEQHRRLTKTSHAEPILNLPDIFDRALALVHATTSPKPAHDGLTADGRAASDSFDDDTFYSSRHDTPESRLAARIPSAEATQLPLAPSQSGVHLHPSDAIVVDDASTRENNRSRSLSGSYEPPPAVPVENRHAHRAQPPDLQSDVESALAVFHNQSTSGVASLPRDSGYVQASELRGYGASHNGQSTGYTEARPPSPLIRAHNLTPAAPQPSHVSFLAINSRLADLQDGTATIRPPVAQVAALRHHESTATSPESSPQSGRLSDNRKKKKKRRKSDRPVESDLLVIKPEPRSPSPINAPALQRPRKRARHGQEAEQESRELRQSNRQLPTQNYYVDAVRDNGQRVEYDSGPSYQGQTTPLLASDRYEREVYEQRPDGSLVRRRISPSRSVAYYDSMAPQRPRAVSHLPPSEPHTEQPRYYREPYDDTMSARPERDYVMAPPRSYSRRIIVDSNGREYLEPGPQPPVRYSGAPQRVEEPEIVYERAPVRAVSRHPGSYIQEPAFLPRPLSQAPARRIVTQPEPLAPQYREYSARPTGPHGSSMLRPERRADDELVGSHIARSTTVRPASSRYDIAPEYVRVSSVRPPQDPAMVEYRASVRPEYQTEVTTQGYMREYRQPAEQGYVRREFSTRPMERFYEPQQGPGAQDVAYIERTRRATGEVVYADEGGRDMYR